MPNYFPIAVLGLLNVAPLVAWLLGLGPFHVWFAAVAVPALCALVVIGAWAARRHRQLHVALVAGAVGGLLGTAGYDLVRVPFAIAGLQVFAPIDSYGVLMLDAASSSAWTGLAGWLFHLANGVGFGIAYALVAVGRPWWWAVVWGLLLETSTVMLPFADVYGLTGHPWLIALAFAAHVAYGAPLGYVVQHAERWHAQLREVSPRTTSYALGSVAAALLLWQHPWAPSADVAAGEAVAAGPSGVIREDHLHPRWLRLPYDGCAVIRNDDATPATLTSTRLPDPPEIEPGASERLCAGRERVAARVRVGERAWSGGFVLVDPERR